MPKSMETMLIEHTSTAGHGETLVGFAGGGVHVELFCIILSIPKPKLSTHTGVLNTFRNSTEILEKWKSELQLPVRGRSI